MIVFPALTKTALLVLLLHRTYATSAWTKKEFLPAATVLGNISINWLLTLKTLDVINATIFVPIALLQGLAQNAPEINLELGRGLFPIVFVQLGSFPSIQLRRIVFV